MARETKSKYGGKFVKTNGRTNNSSEYNHVYYLRNKHKWKGREIDGTYYDNVRSYNKNGEKGWEFYSETEERTKKGVTTRENSIAVIPTKRLFSRTTEFESSHTIFLGDYNIKDVMKQTTKYIGADKQILKFGKQLIDKILNKPSTVRTKQTNGGFGIRR